MQTNETLTGVSVLAEGLMDAVSRSPSDGGTFTVSLTAAGEMRGRGFGAPA